MRDSQGLRLVHADDKQSADVIAAGWGQSIYCLLRGRDRNSRDITHMDAIIDARELGWVNPNYQLRPDIEAVPAQPLHNISHLTRQRFDH